MDHTILLVKKELLPKLTTMPNCHKLFIEFNSNTQITSSKREKLKKSKDALRKTIINWFKKNQPDYVPEFYIQGSYKMATLIRTKEDTCDLDDGIHFYTESDVSPDKIREWVYQAVKDQTDGGAEKKSKCIRVIYKGDYHIDLPIYKKGENDSYPWLAVKGKEWDEEESDPKGFVDWYKERKTAQMTRVIRYLKTWGDNVRNNMLSGLAMTLLAEKYLQEDERDDTAFVNTLETIKLNLTAYWGIIMPVKSYDNPIVHHDDAFRKKFFKCLDAIIDDGKKALEEDSELEASKLWRKHLGMRFPLGEDNKDDKRSNIGSLYTISNSGVQKPYSYE